MTALGPAKVDPTLWADFKHRYKRFARCRGRSKSGQRRNKGGLSAGTKVDFVDPPLISLVFAGQDK